MSKSICLAIICKNESHCIIDAISSVSSFINYWVICDTGSTDDTCEKIEKYFSDKKIPGMLYHDEWVSMGHNKSLMMSRAKDKADYIFHLDADDVFYGDFDRSVLETDSDCYFINAKRGSYFYKSWNFFKGSNLWRFAGVAHTIIKNLDKPNFETYTINRTDFYLISQGSGARSMDPNKFYKDAEILKKQFFDTLLEDPDDLNSRSVFYTAQSYFDAGDYVESIRWNRLYQKLSSTWAEEVFESQLRIVKAMRCLEYPIETLVMEADKAISIFPDRAETYLAIGRFLNENRKHDLSYDYLKKAKNLQFKSANDKYLFCVDEMSYGKYLNDELSVACYWLGKYQEGYDLLMEVIDDSEFANDRDRLLTNKYFFEQKLHTTERSDIINTIIKKINAKRYLEIGVADGNNFRKIDCAYKLGVDPDPTSEALIQEPSDDFFAKNKIVFDVIFIDGLHTKEQLEKDILNSLNFLSEGGWIICHDVNPTEEVFQKRERIGNELWCGDVWKTFVEIRTSYNDLTTFTVDTDFGCGLITRKSDLSNEMREKIEMLTKSHIFTLHTEELSYSFLEQNRKNALALTSVETFKKVFE
jgi:glycosyltransferase involved in cell wall biosynthesis